jgi:hypothetical protein
MSNAILQSADRLIERLAPELRRRPFEVDELGGMVVRAGNHAIVGAFRLHCSLPSHRDTSQPDLLQSRKSDSPLRTCSLQMNKSGEVFAVALVDALLCTPFAIICRWNMGTAHPRRPA